MIDKLIQNKKEFTR